VHAVVIQLPWIDHENPTAGCTSKVRYPSRCFRFVVPIISFLGVVFSMESQNNCPRSQARLEAYQDPTGTSHPHAGDSVVSFDALYSRV
jgi:hypothetical protein